MSQELLSEIYNVLNTEQKEVFDQCINGSSSVFCTGAGGTGKSMILNYVVKYFRCQQREYNNYVAVTASTGIAAFNISGITLHRFAGTGIEEQNIAAMISRASKGQAATNWKNTSVLIIDEISMISPVFFANLSFVAASIRGVDKPFGGIRLLVFGDFLQLPPVSKLANPMTGIFTTDAWSELNIKTIQLRTVIRQSNVQFQSALTEIRYGICSQKSEQYFKSLERDLIFNDGIEPIRLFATRATTDAFNQSRLNELEGNELSFKSNDSGNSSTLTQCPVSATLNLKIGCQVMLVRNINESAVNGSIGTVIRFGRVPGQVQMKPVIKFTSLTKGEFEMTMNRCSWEVIAPNGSVIATRIQYPLSLAWAITIHKSQGQTIPRVDVDMSGIFETGQAYVALSRCPNPDNLRVQNFDPKVIIASAAAVQFYQDIDAREYNDNSPEYTVANRDEPAPDYTEDNATEVAQDTMTTWDNNTVLQGLQSTLTVETQVMLGNLRLQNPPSS